MKNTRYNNFKAIAVALLTVICVQINAQNDWDAISVPPDAGLGNEWILNDDASDSFNYTFDATATRTTFGPPGEPAKWINFFHNNFQGPGATNWEEENVSVSGGFLRLLNDRDFNPDGSAVMKSYQFGGETISRPETQSGCITGVSTNRVIYPVFVETMVRVMNSSLASDVWLLSADDKEEIDIIEAYGGAQSDGRNAFFAERIHLSHHVFIRPPNFRDYQPSDWNSWFTRTGVSSWGGIDVRIGVYWKSPTIIEYYIDGELVRILDNDAIASKIPNGTWEYSYPAGVTSTGQSGQLERIDSGQMKGFQDMDFASSLEEAKQLSEISVIDPFNYLENGRRFSRPLDIIINTEDQSWQAAANRSPNNTEILNATDNTMLVDWIRVYKPVPTGDRSRSLTFNNKSNYIEPSETKPNFAIGQKAEIDITYATGITGGVEEDLTYVFVQIQQLDENDMQVAISDFVTPINGAQANATTTSFQYTIPSTFDDGTTTIPMSEDLPTGHKLKLLLSMAVDGATEFANADEEIIIKEFVAVVPDDRTRSISFDNRSDFILIDDLAPTFELGQQIDFDITYATGLSDGVEEDLTYIATFIRELDEGGITLKDSAFTTVVFDSALDKATTTYSYTIPTEFTDGSTIPTTAELDSGHKLILVLFMSVNDNGAFADANGEVNLVSSGSLSITTIENETITSVSPNPFSNGLTINSGFEGSWKLFDLNGKVIIQGKGDTVNGSSLPSSIYLLTLETGEVIKVIKE